MLQAGVVIPKDILMQHWQTYAKAVLPFLIGRPVTLEQVFNQKVIYRRYTDKTKSQLIRVNSVKDVMYWANLHTYAFHPYICHADQKAKCWYVLDIDPENNVDFKLTKHLTYSIVDYLEKHGFKDITTAFCGKNGFHIFAPLKEKDPKKVYKINKQTSFDLAVHLVNNCNTPVRIELTSKDEMQRFTQQNATKCKQADQDAPLIKLDTRIMHSFGNIRSPYSIHSQTGLWSVVVSKQQILDFDINSAKLPGLDYDF